VDRKVQFVGDALGKWLGSLVKGAACADPSYGWGAAVKCVKVGRAVRVSEAGETECLPTARGLHVWGSGFH